jgi:glycosyltransferase involved in cell wall biosynthesis
VATRKKICIASGIYPPDTGGPAKFTETFISWCQAIRVDTNCVALTNEKTHTKRVNSTNIYLISRSQNLLLRYWHTVTSLAHQMRSGNLVLANGLFLETLFASLITGKSYACKVPGDIVWERARNRSKTNLSIDEFQKSKKPLKYQIFRLLFTASLRRAKLVIVPSTHLFNLCLVWGVKRENLHLIYNSVDTQRFSPKESVEKKYDVLVLNRLVSWKHVDEVIIACSQLNLTLVVVGDGPERFKLEELALMSQANVDFLGEIKQSKLPELIRSAHCYVLNSSFEATSYSLLEARASGLFCIANGHTGSDEIIHHEVDGLLCDKDKYPLTAALDRYRTDKTFVAEAQSLSVLDTRKRFNLESNFKLIRDLVFTI